jgi:hypothetical protein
VNPRAGLHDVDNRKFSSSDPWAVQPVASRCTDCAIPAQISTYLCTDIILTTIVSNQLVAMKAYLFIHLIFYASIWLSCNPSIFRVVFRSIYFPTYIYICRSLYLLVCLLTSLSSFIFILLLFLWVCLYTVSLTLVGSLAGLPCWIGRAGVSG